MPGVNAIAFTPTSSKCASRKHFPRALLLCRHASASKHNTPPNMRLRHPPITSSTIYPSIIPSIRSRFFFLPLSSPVLLCSLCRPSPIWKLSWARSLGLSPKAAFHLRKCFIPSSSTNQLIRGMSFIPSKYPPPPPSLLPLTSRVWVFGSCVFRRLRSICKIMCWTIFVSLAWIVFLFYIYIYRHVHRHFGGQVLKPKKRAPNAKKNDRVEA